MGRPPTYLVWSPRSAMLPIAVGRPSARPVRRGPPTPKTHVGHVQTRATGCFREPKNGCYAGAMAVHTILASALIDIDAFDGAPQDFALSIDESLLDPAGLSMALVTDSILAKGWMPDGVEPRDGYRVFRYCLA